MLVYAKCLFKECIPGVRVAQFGQFLSESEVAQVDVCASGN